MSNKENISFIEHILNPIPDRINSVVIAVNRLGQNLSLPVLIPRIPPQLLDDVHAVPRYIHLKLLPDKDECGLHFSI